MTCRIAKLMSEGVVLALLSGPAATALQNTAAPPAGNIVLPNPQQPASSRQMAANGGRKDNEPLAAKAAPGVDAGTDARPRPSEIADQGSYRIGEQDLLNIVVWREPELSGAVIVRPDGKITLPLVNDIQASGLTPAELRNVLTEKLRPFVTVPEVTVAVREINSRKIFVIGQIAHEGSYRINSTTTILQIIAEAGGLNEFAARKRIYLLRKENGIQVRFNFNYDNVVKGKDTSQNIVLRPGDTIVVP